MHTPAWGLSPASIMIHCDGDVDKSTWDGRTDAHACGDSMHGVVTGMIFLNEAGNAYSQPTEVCVQARRLSEPLRERSANTKKVILIKEGAKVKTVSSIVCLSVSL